MNNDNLFDTNWAENKKILLEGLTGNRKNTVNQVMENTKKFMKQNLMETAPAGATGAASIATLNKVMLPLIRRVMPSVIANELVGVQPMTGPIGQIHTLRIQYNEDDGVVKPGTEALSPFDLATQYSGNPDATSAAEGTPGRRMGIRILKETIEAQTRRLSASWTLEAAQDAHAMHGIDVEAEVMQALAQEIVVEIDQQIIGSLRNLAGNGRLLDFGSNANMANGGTAALAENAGHTPDSQTLTPLTGTPHYVGDRHAVLAVAINREANTIAARTRRGTGNYCVVSTEALTVLQTAQTSTFARTTEIQAEAPTNTKLVGTLNGTIRVFADNYAQDGEKVLIGYKGTSETDAPAFYCPYIPLMSTGPVMDPARFVPVTSFMTRYGYKELTNTASSLGNAADYVAAVQMRNVAFG